jgi:hypothetical protein
MHQNVRGINNTIKFLQFFHKIKYTHLKECLYIERQEKKVDFQMWEIHFDSAGYSMGTEIGQPSNWAASAWVTSA